MVSLSDDSGMNYLIFSQNHWDSPLKYQRHRLAEYLSDREDTQSVWYFSRVPMRAVEAADFKRLAQRFRRAGGGGRELSNVRRPVPSKVTLCRPYLYDGIGVPLLSRVSERLFLSRISRLGLDWSRTIVISYQPISALNALKKRFNPFRMVYVSVHDFESMPGVSRRVCEVEKHLIENADLAATDSSALAEKLLGDPSASYLAPACGEDVIHLSRQRSFYSEGIRKLVYFGTIASYLDWDLIEGLLEDGIRVDFMGKNHDMPTSYLERFPNLSVLPASDFERAARTLWDYDGVILPYKVDHRNDLIIPAKVYEMISLGMPVFVPRMKWSQQAEFIETLYVYDGLKDLLGKIHGFNVREFLPRRECMFKLAEENTWEGRFENLLEKVLGLCQRN